MKINYNKFYTKNQEAFGKSRSWGINKIINYQKPPAKILDLGVGYGRNAFYLANQGFDITGVEISKVAIGMLKDESKKRNLDIKIYQQNMKDFEFQKKFDVIYSVMSLQFLKNKEEVSTMIRKIKSHTKNGGVNLISVPTDIKKAREFPYFFTKNELFEYYRDWEILESKKEVITFINGNQGTVSRMIARKK